MYPRKSCNIAVFTLITVKFQNVIHRWISKYALHMPCPIINDSSANYWSNSQNQKQVIFENFW